MFWVFAPEQLQSAVFRSDRYSSAPFSPYPPYIAWFKCAQRANSGARVVNMSDQALPTRTIQTTICGVTSSAEFTTARETLATTTDKDAQSLLGMMVCRNINLRVSREHAFTPELVVSYLNRR